MLYSICGLTVEFEPLYPRLRKRAEKYLLTGNAQTPDMTLKITEQDIDAYAQTRKNSSKELAEYALCGVEFYSKMLDFDGFFLHSSAVALDNEAYLFTAHCGGGKSTHASLWRRVFPGCTVINDDKPAIRCIDGKFFACGTPFSGKHDISANVMVPVRGICVIEQAEENRIERIPASAAAHILLEQTQRRLNIERTEVLLSLFDDLLSSVPVYRLHCNISPEAAYLSYSTMSGKNRIKFKNF